MLCIVRTMLMQMSVCLSVRPFVTPQYCVETAKYIIRLFVPSASHTILTFPYQTLWQYSDSDSVMGMSNAGGMIFDRYFALSWKWYKIGQLTLSGPFILTGSINRVPTCPAGVKAGGHLVTSVGWQITLFDRIDKWRPVVLRWISLRTIRSFIFFIVTMECE